MNVQITVIVLNGTAIDRIQGSKPGYVCIMHTGRPCTVWERSLCYANFGMEGWSQFGPMNVLWEPGSVAT